MTPRKVDRNQAEIVQTFRKLGATVQHLHTVGRGCPDLLLGVDDVNVLVEVKDGNGHLTPDQEQWHANWRGSVRVIRSVDEAVNLILAVRAD